jgi:hypothetical protein
MNLLSQNERIRKFLLMAIEYDLKEPVSCDILAKELQLELPEVFRGATIQDTTSKGGTKHITWANLKYPWLAGLFSFLAKTRCALICWDGADDKLHCIHICVTCFDSWPGPGCYIHGSYN